MIVLRFTRRHRLVLIMNTTTRLEVPINQSLQRLIRRSQGRYPLLLQTLSAFGQFVEVADGSFMVERY